MPCFNLSKSGTRLRLLLFLSLALVATLLVVIGIGVGLCYRWSSFENSTAAGSGDHDQVSSSSGRLPKLNKNWRSNPFVAGEETKASSWPNTSDAADYFNQTTKEKGDTTRRAILPTNVTHQEIVNGLLIPLASQTRLEDFVRTFSSFFNRHYQSESGVRSEQWLLSQVESSLVGYNNGRSGGGCVREVSHDGWRQNSIVARIEGSDPELKSEVVILGAHQDSMSGGINDKAPGADDDASGSSVVLETLRVLAEAGFRPERTIDFHWYAAGEPGFLGSTEIAEEYKEEEVSVVGVLYLDVLGYQPQPNSSTAEEIVIYTDSVGNGNDELIGFLGLVADAYLDFSWRNKTCAYSCSSGSWTNVGFAAAVAAGAEANHNVNIHTPSDTFDTVGFGQVLEFVKLAIGFAVEVAGAAE